MVTTPVQQAAAVDVVSPSVRTGQVTPGTTLTYTIAAQETTANPTAIGGGTSYPRAPL